MSEGRRYMHTLDNRPAFFDGEQIVFAPIYPHRKGRHYPIPLVASRAQIDAEQRASDEWRRRRGFGDQFEYGFVVVEVTP